MRVHPPALGAVLLALFTAALFLSALLLFSVQPMFAKMALPVLGGSPAVWSVALVFFQALLLAGYAYAHGLASLHTLAAGAIHLALMAVAFVAMPITLASGWSRPPAGAEALWAIGLFTVSVGLPFFAIAGNGPLLQAWFARSGHELAADPYFLYAASNIGSFAGLLAYPLAIEPFLALSTQSRAWMAGFATLALLVLGCATAAARNQESPQRGGSSAAFPLSWAQRSAWMALAAVPSGLLVAVTAHISTDNGGAASVDSASCALPVDLRSSLP